MGVGGAGPTPSPDAPLAPLAHRVAWYNGRSLKRK